MKKTEMLQTLKLQYKNTTKEIDKLQLEIQKKKDILIKLEGALEALEALEPDEPAPAKPAADHTDAARVLGVFN
jgi:chromosome segregation ATPase